MLHSSEIHGSSKAREYLSGWQRARADLDNFRRRVHQEQQQQNEQVKRRLIYDLMPLIDNFRAITIHLPADLKDNVWAQGVLHVTRQLEQLLSQYNVVPINESGQPFNPVLHEAVATVEDNEASSGSIVEILQTGYKIGDQVIRPAKVKVAK
jgi:molecular chaperone GrpE